MGYGDGWFNLVLPDGHKETVLALVQNQARAPESKQQFHDNRNVEMDLVCGKGKELIIVLHGMPGVGRTSTAECVADHTHRQLFPITCVDVGERPEKVEENLEKTFQLAHRCGCVLLIDEAEYLHALYSFITPIG